MKDTFTCQVLNYLVEYMFLIFLMRRAVGLIPVGVGGFEDEEGWRKGGKDTGEYRLFQF